MLEVEYFAEMRTGAQQVVDFVDAHLVSIPANGPFARQGPFFQLLHKLAEYSLFFQLARHFVKITH